MTSSINARKRQRQRRQKARAKARKLAARQAAVALRDRPTENPPQVAPSLRPEPSSKPEQSTRRVPVAPVRPAPREQPRETEQPRVVPPPQPEPVVARTTAGVLATVQRPAPRVPMDRPTDLRDPWRRRKLLGGAAAVLASVAAVAATLMVTHPGSDTGTGALGPAAASRYAPPRSLPPGTSHIRTRVLPSGHLRVTHWIHSRAPVRTIRLHEPSVAQLGNLKLTRVVVAGDRAPAIHDVTRKDEYDVGGARNVYVSYELSGAVTRAPRPTGRALAVVTNLDVTGPPSPSRVTHAVLGARILNLACSTASPAAVPTPCGTPDRSGWHVTLDGSGVTDQVMAQVDLDADAAG